MGVCCVVFGSFFMFGEWGGTERRLRGAAVPVPSSEDMVASVVAAARGHGCCRSDH